METRNLPESGSRRPVSLSRTAHDRPRVDWPERDREAVDAPNEPAVSFPRSGFRKCCALLARRGFSWNHKRVYRVYRAMGLNMPRPAKKKALGRLRGR